MICFCLFCALLDVIISFCTLHTGLIRTRPSE